MKERFVAVLYYMLIILAVYITGCRNALPPNEINNDINLTTALTAPSQVEAISNSITTIEINWINTDASDLQKVMLEYKKSTDSDYTSVDVQTSESHTLTNLEENMDYDIRLKSVATDGHESDYSSVVSATTQTPPDNSHPQATISTAAVYDGQIHIMHTWSSTDSSHIQNIFCESKLSSSTVWAAYKTGTSTNFGDSAFCYTNINGAENIGKRQYRIRVQYNDAYPQTTSNMTTELTAKLPASTNPSATMASMSTINWNWMDTFDPAYHTGFTIGITFNLNNFWCPTSVSSLSTAYNDYNVQTNICSQVINCNLGGNVPVSGHDVTFTITAIGGWSTAHHDYPKTSSSTTITGHCP